ncbi:unnamed protein product [Closterium sp. NIES-54]
MPLGRNEGRTSIAGVNFKWAEAGKPKRQLGLGVMPDGDAALSWEKAWERGKGEAIKWENQHLLTAARVTLINNYVMLVFLFQAQIYPPPEELWAKIPKSFDNDVSKGEAAADKICVLWSGEQARLPKKEGGMGLVDPKDRLDSLAIRMVGKLLTEQNFTKRKLEVESGCGGVLEVVVHESPGADQWVEGGAGAPLFQPPHHVLRQQPFWEPEGDGGVFRDPAWRPAHDQGGRGADGGVW